MEFIGTALELPARHPASSGSGTQIGFVWKGLVFLVALLIFTAYILLADRKIWAAVQIRRGPNVVGAVRPAAVASPTCSSSCSRSR